MSALKGHRCPVRREHTVPNGGTCLDPDPAQCRAWDHLLYAVRCECDWSTRSKIRAVVEEKRRYHLSQVSRGMTTAVGVRLRRGQRVTYTTHRWAGDVFEVIDRFATVLTVDGHRVRVVTDFDHCRVWMPAAGLSPEVRP